MIPATFVGLLLAYWAVKLRNRVGAPSLVRWIPLALLAVFAVGWPVTIRGVRVAWAGDPSGVHMARMALAAVGAALGIIGAALVLGALRVRRANRSSPGDYLP